MTEELRSELARISARAKYIVHHNIFNFWRQVAMDSSGGGFAGRVSADNNPDFSANRSLIHTSRLVWAFSRGYRAFKTDLSKELAAHGYSYFTRNFIDKKNGGLFWTVDAQGRPVNERKQTYGQAFGIYALSEYYMATGAPAALDLALGLFGCVQKYCTDSVNGGYWEARGADWSPIEDVRLSLKDLNEKKSNNTHLHVLEALTSLLKAKENDRVRRALSDVVKIFMTKVYNRADNHFILFQDEFWNARCDIVSFGHEIEAAWLVTEALDTLGEAALKDEFVPAVVAISRNALENYLDGPLGENGMSNESLGGEIDRQKIWWVQNEAAIGFLNAFSLTGDEDFLKAAVNVWDFCEKSMIDHERGEWWEVAGTDVARGDKVHEWKSCYHNTRMCIEIIERCKTILKK